MGAGVTQLVDLPVPEPGRGQVRIRVAAAGICHSDVRMIEGTSVGAVDAFAPFTLGHEISGVVDELGADVDPAMLGMEVAVYGPEGCLVCMSCTEGKWNYCDRRTPNAAAGVGIGRDGGLAEYVVVDPRRLVAARGVDMAAAAVLTDAGLTSHHAVSTLDWKAAGPRTAVVLGVGGLGHLAVQALAFEADVTVIAVDGRPEASDLAMRSGAHAFAQPHELEDVVGELTRGRGVAAVLDFVGSSSTMLLGESVLGSLGEFVLVGSAGGGLQLSKGRVGPRRGLSYRVPIWGSLGELSDVLDRARLGRLRPEMHFISLVEAEQGMRDLAAGTVSGRLVVTEF
ncbi:alcohol dehydrogenase catalytic domain-containing protein [Microbacterium sp. zg.B185]|nr:alcohol dehydrogenase catalytic domain-containing protein [Microbacterium sp. zg.B185]MCR2811316.1 alcohol dehydrogenase catalytic domain-containing protein [Microbacterium sp. zg.B185]